MENLSRIINNLNELHSHKNKDVRETALKIDTLLSKLYEKLSKQDRSYIDSQT